MLDEEECIKGINQLKYNSKSKRSLSNRAINKKNEKKLYLHINQLLKNV